ncbi:MAG: hypothetical protein ACTTH7_03700 [Treponema sp.]
MKKQTFYFLAIAAIAAAVITCSLSVIPSGMEAGSTSHLNPLSRAVDSAFLAEQAYMGGSILYNPEEPSSGHLIQGAVIALRLSKVEKKAVDSTEIFTDDLSAEVFGALTVQSIDTQKIGFEVSLFSKNGVTKNTYQLSAGSKIDINGDSIDDLEYAAPAHAHAGFTSAVYLTCLSSQEQLTTTMFSVLPEQYSTGNYPSGIIGINPDGQFLYAKFQPNSTVRSIVRGLSDSDFVLDTEMGGYVQASGVTGSTNQRSISDADLSNAQPVAIVDVLPLASWSSGKVANKGIPVVAETYEEYTAKKAALKKDFAMYRELVSLPVQSVTDKINEFEQIDAETAIGVYGRFLITWSRIETDLFAGVYFSGKLDLTVKEALTQNLKTIGPYEFENSYSFAIGPIPLTVACPIRFEMPIDVKVTSDPDSSFVVAFTGIYGAGIDVGAAIDWNKIFRKGFVEPRAEAYPVANGVFYAGGTSNAVSDKNAVILTLETAPSVYANPKIGVAGTVWTGVEGSYMLPVAIGISAKETGAMDSWITLSHEGAINWYAGLKIGTFKKEFKPTLLKIGPKEIKKWHLLSGKL